MIRAFGLVLLGLFAPPLWAQTSVTNTLTGEYRGDNANNVDTDDDYGILINRLNLAMTGAEGFVGQLRADVFGFLPEPPDAGYQNTYQIERASVRYTHGPWRFILGDFYRQLGRGIALSLRKNEETSVDVTVQGGQVAYQDTDHHATLFAGRTNPANLDGISQRYVEDTHDLLVGASYDFNALELIKLGAFGLFLRNRETLLDQHNTTLSGGLTATLPAPTEWLSVYLEGDVQRREVIGVSSLGYAGYATVDLTFVEGDLTFLIEGVYLQDYELQGSRNTALEQAFDYNQPPTLERIDQEVVNLRDVGGAALRSDYYFFDLELLLFAAANVRLNEPLSVAPIRSVHGYAGAELFFQEGVSRVRLTAGYRDESQRGRSLKTILHAELDYLQSLVLEHRVSLHLQVQHEQRTLEDVGYERGTTLLTLEWARAGSVGFEFSYDTQNPRDDVRNYFYAGVLDWDIVESLDVDALDELRLALLVGTRRGGLRCVAGVCRNFPEFAGVQTRVILRY